MAVPMADSDGALLRGVEAFLYREAELLDDRAFEQWLDLLDEDFRYVIPSVAVGVPDASDRAGDPRCYNSLYDDTKSTLERRIRRLRLPTAWAENPPSRTCRLIGNVRIVAAQADDRLTVRSSFVVHKARFDLDTVSFAGTRIDVLYPIADDWRLASRTVRLIEGAIAHHNLSVFF